MDLFGARVRSVNELGPWVAKPGANGFLPLLTLDLDAGRALLVNLHQAVQVNPTTTVLDRLIAGLDWKLFVVEKGATLEASQTAAQEMKVWKRANAWTYVDGHPVARRVYVEAASGRGSTVSWGIDVAAFATIPAAIVSFAGAVHGYEIPAAWRDSDRLLELARSL
jgi:hypothetical protein